MTQYRDIGSIGGSTGSNIPVESFNQGQVYNLTHFYNNITKEWQSLPSLDRSFISFSWGEKNIEDFGFIIISNGDRYQRMMYASFQDYVSNTEIMDGQKYWGYKFNANNIIFDLATDGVLESTLQQFRNWFKPGIVRDLVLSEHPNRVISARIAEAPAYSLLPFKEKTIKKINGIEYESFTTKWKGEISLTFVMDEPFWKNKISYFEGNLDKEQIKIIEEDNIPHIDMFQNVSCFLANNKYCLYDSSASPSIIIKDAESIDILPNENFYLYNCGTGIIKPIIKFDFTPEWEQIDNKDVYINFPKNSYTDAQTPYNTISVGNKIFKFTTPSVLTSYNQAVKIALNYSEGDSIIDFKNELRDSINNNYVRVCCVGLCELSVATHEDIGICDNNGGLTSDFLEKFIFNLKKIFVENSTFNCYINSELGIAEMSYSLNLLRPYVDVNDDLIIDYRQIDIKENIGDMIYSDYLIIDEQTLPSIDLNGNIIITSEDCLIINADCNLKNFQIIYNYMYL